LAVGAASLGLISGCVGEATSDKPAPARHPAAQWLVGSLMRTRLLALLALPLAAGCGWSGSHSSHYSARHPTRSMTDPAPRSSAGKSRLIVLVMENKGFSQVIGSRAAPYENALAHRYALARRYYGISHPSLPNYLSLIGGSTFGIRSDCTSCKVKAKNLVDQLEAARVSWRAYMEDLPAPCYGGGAAGRYAKKHNPFAYFEDIRHDSARCSKVVPLGRLRRDLRSTRFPRFSWITPNLCHDTHDCSIRAGDRFLARLVPRLLRRLGSHGAFLLLWDEGTSDRGGGGHIPAIVAGPDVRRRHLSRVRLNHYSTLRTIEDAFGLPHLRGAACPCTRPLDSLFRRPPRHLAGA
jgi:phosphatidylinositol-3-phosphatase